MKQSRWRISLHETSAVQAFGCHLSHAVVVGKHSPSWLAGCPSTFSLGTHLQEADSRAAAPQPRAQMQPGQWDCREGLKSLSLLVGEGKKDSRNEGCEQPICGWGLPVDRSCLEFALLFTTELQRFCWVPWSGSSFLCYWLQTRTAKGLWLSGLCCTGSHPHQCQFSPLPTQSRQVCRAAVLAGLCQFPPSHSHHWPVQLCCCPAVWSKMSQKPLTPHLPPGDSLLCCS